MSAAEREIKIGYIILHYQTFDETCACVETLKTIFSTEDVIIIVDNYSPDGSGGLLYQKYQHESNIIVILNSCNMGFACGNNVGYDEAKHKYKCDFIVMLNSDVLIAQNDFRDAIISAYYRYHFAVMGPKILQKDGTNSKCSPIMPVHTNLRRVRIGQVSNYIRYFLSFFNLDILFGRIVDDFPSDAEFADKYQENVQIAGCCFIFSRDYIDKFDGLNPKTFMYLEEILLYVRIKKAGLNIMYNPELEIVHLENVSTKKVFTKNKKARQFKYKSQMKSFRVLIEELKTN